MAIQLRSSFYDLPLEVIRQIFSNFCPQNAFRNQVVCRLFRTVMHEKSLLMDYAELYHLTVHEEGQLTPTWFEGKKDFIKFVQATRLKRASQFHRLSSPMQKTIDARLRTLPKVFRRAFDDRQTAYLEWIMTAYHVQDNMEKYDLTMYILFATHMNSSEYLTIFASRIPNAIGWNSAFSIAAQQGHFVCLQVILNSAQLAGKIEATDLEDKVNKAVQRGFTECTKILLDFPNASEIEASAFGENLKIAIENDDSESVHKLIQKADQFQKRLDNDWSEIFKRIAKRDRVEYLNWILTSTWFSWRISPDTLNEALTHFMNANAFRSTCALLQLPQAFLIPAFDLNG